MKTEKRLKDLFESETFLDSLKLPYYYYRSDPCLRIGNFFVSVGGFIIIAPLVFFGVSMVLAAAFLAVAVIVLLLANYKVLLLLWGAALWAAKKMRLHRKAVLLFCHYTDGKRMAVYA